MNRTPWTIAVALIALVVAGAPLCSFATDERGVLVCEPKPEGSEP